MGDREGRSPSPGKILGAEITTRGGHVTAVLFENEDGSGGYYTPDGRALSRDFLRYPVEFREISSEFSGARYHPILHRWRPHTGRRSRGAARHAGARGGRRLGEGRRLDGRPRPRGAARAHG